MGKIVPSLSSPEYEARETVIERTAECGCRTVIDPGVQSTYMVMCNSHANMFQHIRRTESWTQDEVNCITHAWEVYIFSNGRKTRSEIVWTRKETPKP